MSTVEPGLLGVLIIESSRSSGSAGGVASGPQWAGRTVAGLPIRSVQGGTISSPNGMLRGLYYQHPSPQGRLIHVVRGVVYNVVVDIRVGSPSFARWMAITLRAGEGRRLLIPEGFAHGFLVTSDSATVACRVTAPDRPREKRSLLWNDPDLSIAWPVADPMLSIDGWCAPRLGEIPLHRLPRYDRAQMSRIGRSQVDPSEVPPRDPRRPPDPGEARASCPP